MRVSLLLIYGSLQNKQQPKANFSLTQWQYSTGQTSSSCSFLMNYSSTQRLASMLRQSHTRTWNSRCGIWEARPVSGLSLALFPVCDLVLCNQCKYEEWEKSITISFYRLIPVTLMCSSTSMSGPTVVLLIVLLNRPYWRCYYSNTDAIIYVVDSSDRDRMGISKSELVAMLEVSRAWPCWNWVTEMVSGMDYYTEV